MRMLCYKCGHPWNYKGKNTEGEGYITCPGCLYKIRVDKALIEGSSEQRLLTSLPKKRVKTTSFPLKLPTTSFTIEFETIKDKDGFVYRVDKRMPEQFKETLRDEEIEEIKEVEEMQEQELAIRILPPKFKIIKIIPRDPIKITEHQLAYRGNLL